MVMDRPGVGQRVGLGQGDGSRWVSWWGLVWVVVAVTVLKLLLLVWVSPLDLVADEAHYWDWSRRLMLSYYTKGPGVAWTIAASTGVFGDVAWAVRLPSVLACGVTALVLGRVAWLVSGREAAAWYAGVAYLCVPGFLVTSLLMTIDGPYLMCWALALWAGLGVRRGLKGQRSGADVGNREGAVAVGSVAWGAWVGLGAAIGVGALYKYTVLLLLPGLVLDWVWHVWRGWRGGDEGRAADGRGVGSFRWTAGQWAGLGLGVLTLLVCLLPIGMWNQARGWPTVAHLLGHLRVAGGDTAPVREYHYDPMWTLEFLGTQAGYVGIAGLLMGLAVWWGMRRVWRGEVGSAGRVAGGADLVEPTADVPGGGDPLGGVSRGEVFYLLACGLPILVFYLLVSLRTDAEGNWPVAGYLSLLVLVGVAGAWELPRYRRKLAAWRSLPEPRPRWGLARRRPETAFQVGWHWTLVVGLIVPVVFFGLPVTAYIPGLASRSPVFRLTGHEAAAMRVQRVREALAQRTGREPWLVASTYGDTSLLAFYLPDRPTVLNASTLAGGRTTAYDYFADTRFIDPPALTPAPVSDPRAVGGVKRDTTSSTEGWRDRDALLGRPVVMYGGSAAMWEALFVLDGLREVASEASTGEGGLAEVAASARAGSQSGRRRSVFVADAYGGLRPGVMTRRIAQRESMGGGR